MTTNADSEIVGLVQQVRERFPLDAQLTDAWLVERGWEPAEAVLIWIESFAEQTTEAIRTSDWTKVRQHTQFFSDAYDSGSDSVRKCIDVAYAENLMFGLDGPVKAKALAHVAPRVRRLYEEMWGAPR